MIAIETWLCQILFCLFTFLVGGAPGAYVIAGTLHFRETSGIVTSKVKLRVKTHWGTPPHHHASPPSLSLLLIISVSLSLAVFLYPTLFQHVSKKSAREYKSTIRHSGKLSGVLFPSDQSSGHCVLFAL